MRALNQRRRAQLVAAVAAATVGITVAQAPEPAFAFANGRAYDGSRAAFTWTAPPQTPKPTVSPWNSLGKPWRLCGYKDAKTKVIRSFERYRAVTRAAYLAGGTTNLTCGSTRFGYRHIVDRHLREWRSDAARAGEHWRDLVDFAIESSLLDPDQVVHRPDNNAFCFSREIFLVDNRTGRVTEILRPNIVIGALSEDIITAIPTRKHCS